MSRMCRYLVLFLLSFSFLEADLKVKEFSGLPFIKRNFEQLYLGQNAIVKNDDLIYSNNGTLSLASDLWSLELGLNSRIQWRQEGKVFHLTLIEGSVVLKKVADRKAYLQLNTPNSSSTGEIDHFFVHVNEMTTKIWMNRGHLDFKLKSVALKEKVISNQLLEYRGGDTRIHTLMVDDNLLSKIEKDILEHEPKISSELSAIDQREMAILAESKQRRKENRSYYRSQRASLIESIQEAVLEDGSFTFSIPTPPPPQ